MFRDPKCLASRYKQLHSIFWFMRWLLRYVPTLLQKLRQPPRKTHLSPDVPYVVSSIGRNERHRDHDKYDIARHVSYIVVDMSEVFVYLTADRFNFQSNRLYG